MLANRLVQSSNSRVYVWILIIVLVLTSTACGKANDSEVILTYKDNGEITQDEFDTFINVNKMFSPQMATYIEEPGFQQEMLKQLASYLILSDRASAEVEQAADKQVEEQLKQILDYIGQLEGGLEKQLLDNNLKEEDIEYLLKISFYSMLGMKETITDAQIEDEYKNNLDNHQFEIATVSHILISTTNAATNEVMRTDEEALKRANEVLGKLKLGEDFAKLALEYSDDPGSKEKGGKYEDVSVNQWVAEFKQAAIDLPLNTLSEPPVKTEFGYHVMKVENRRIKTIEEAREEIEKTLMDKIYSDFYENELTKLILTNKLAKSADESPAPSDELPESTDIPATP